MVHSLCRILRCEGGLARNPISLLIRRNRHNEAFRVTWKKPDIGWTKLNFDGSTKNGTGMSSIGGIFRDHKAEFLLGYAETIGPKTSTIAELTALHRGLELVLENGWHDVWLEGDAMTLIDIIVNKKPVRSEEVKRLITHINLIISELRNWSLTHIYREGNRAADKFAKMGHKFSEPRIWRNPPKEVLSIVLEDANGRSFPRRI